MRNRRQAAAYATTDIAILAHASIVFDKGNYADHSEQNRAAVKGENVDANQSNDSNPMNKYNFAARAAMLALTLAAAFAVNTSVRAQAPPGSLWYNGDWNAVNGLPNERNTLIPQAAVYDDFIVTAPLGWHVTALFSDNLLSTNVTAADWEIRTGVSEGNAGTLIASGTTNSPVVTQIYCGFSFCEYRVEVTGLNVTLVQGHYWLNVTPVGNGTGRSFNVTTSGLRAVGKPRGTNQNAFFNSAYFGTYFTSTANWSQPYDYSMGVIGTVVPGPGAR